MNALEGRISVTSTRYATTRKGHTNANARKGLLAMAFSAEVRTNVRLTALICQDAKIDFPNIIYRILFT